MYPWPAVDDETSPDPVGGVGEGLRYIHAGISKENTGFIPNCHPSIYVYVVDQILSREAAEPRHRSSGLGRVALMGEDITGGLHSR